MNGKIWLVALWENRRGGDFSSKRVSRQKATRKLPSPVSESGFALVHVLDGLLEIIAKIYFQHIRDPQQGINRWIVVIVFKPTDCGLIQAGQLRQLVFGDV